MPAARLGIALLLLIASAAAGAEPGLVLLVPQGWETPPGIDRTTLRRLFLGKRSRIGGRRIACIAMPPGSTAREAFNAAVLGMSEDELTSYWIEQALLGGALPPEEVEDVDALAERLRAGRFGIGYGLLEGAPPWGVKVLPLASP